MTKLLTESRILIVDDSRMDREIALDALKDEFCVECCENAEQALEALAREPADLVLSDLTMPGLSGLDLLGIVLREHPGTDFIMVTGHASVDSAVGALRMGAVDYLRKPIQAEELQLVVHRTLSRRRLLAENERLNESLQVIEACRALTICLEVGEVYAVASLLTCARSTLVAASTFDFSSFLSLTCFAIRSEACSGALNQG